MNLFHFNQSFSLSRTFFHFMGNLFSLLDPFSLYWTLIRFFGHFLILFDPFLFFLYLLLLFFFAFTLFAISSLFCSHVQLGPTSCGLGDSFTLVKFSQFERFFSNSRRFTSYLFLAFTVLEVNLSDLGKIIRVQKCPRPLELGLS